jgi:hypothetical protein
MSSFFLDQHVSDLGFKDPFAALLESYVSDFLKISDFIISPIFMGEYGFLKEFLYHCCIFLLLSIDQWYRWDHFSHEVT